MILSFDSLVFWSLVFNIIQSIRIRILGCQKIRRWLSSNKLKRVFYYILYTFVAIYLCCSSKVFFGFHFWPTYNSASFRISLENFTFYRQITHLILYSSLLIWIYTNKVDRFVNGILSISKHKNERKNTYV